MVRFKSIAVSAARILLGRRLAYCMGHLSVSGTAWDPSLSDHCAFDFKNVRVMFL